MLDAAAPPATALPKPTLGYAPSTFLERGAWVPFTTPQLAGARVRPAERGGLELIIVNPSGARGVYILPWDGIVSICTPTLHDRALNEKVQAAKGVTPILIRRLALEVAQEGLAGRGAAAAAEATCRIERELVTLTNFELLMRLVGRSGEAAAGATDGITDRARGAVVTIARRLGRTPDAVAAALEELAAFYAPFGIGAAAGRGRLARGQAALVALRAGVESALQASPALISTDADLVVATANLTLVGLDKTMGDAVALLDDLPSMLTLWLDQPDRLAARLTRSDWLLDGWERICVLWAERSGDLEGCLAELADLVPATPREAAGWIDRPVEAMAGAMRGRRRVEHMQDWRSGATVHDLVARNEHLSARLLAELA